MNKPITYTSVSHPRWINPRAIHCIVCFDNIPDGPVPFVASPDDVEPHGREIFAKILQGEFGPIGTVPASEMGTWPAVTTDPIPLWPEAHDVLRKANAENLAGSDTGEVIFWGSVVDDLLQKLLAAHGSSTGGTFAKRISRARDGGLITEGETTALNALREIRNGFGHEALASFDKPELGDKARALFTSLADWKWHPPATRMLFSSSAAMVAMSLHRHLLKAPPGPNQA